MLDAGGDWNINAANSTAVTTKHLQLMRQSDAAPPTDVCHSAAAEPEPLGSNSIQGRQRRADSLFKNACKAGPGWFRVYVWTPPPHAASAFHFQLEAQGSAS